MALQSDAEDARFGHLTLRTGRVERVAMFEEVNMRVIPKTLQVLTTLAFCLTTAAFAQEGSTIKMISQGSVMNAGGFPFKIAKPGSYRLASNLAVPANVDAIDISADNVNLDLNGFTIAGPVTCTGGP